MTKREAIIIGALVVVTLITWLFVWRLLARRQTPAVTAEAEFLDDATARMIERAEADGAEGQFAIHAPAEGCPRGWQLAPHVFRAGGGQAVPGCVLTRSNAGQFALDYLRPQPAGRADGGDWNARRTGGVTWRRQRDRHWNNS